MFLITNVTLDHCTAQTDVCLQLWRVLPAQYNTALTKYARALVRLLEIPEQLVRSYKKPSVLAFPPSPALLFYLT